MMASIAAQGPRQLGPKWLVYASDCYWHQTPENYLLPHLPACELAASIGQSLAAQWAPERSQLRWDVFHDNVLRHWENATRTNPQAPRRPGRSPSSKGDQEPSRLLLMATSAGALRRSAAQRPQRVLMLIDHLDVGGAQQHVALLSGQLVRAGHEVHLLYTGKPAVALPDGVVAVQLLDEKVTRREERCLDALVGKYSDRIKPTVMHAHLFASAIAAGRVAAREGIPLVVTHHSAGTWQRKSDRENLLASLHQAAYHLTVSPQIEQRLLEQGLSPSRVEFMPNGIPVPVNPMRRVQGTDLRVGFLGRLDRDKAPVLAVRALAHAHALGAYARLEMRGAGPLEAKVREAVERFSLQPYFALDGFVADPAELYGRIDVLLLSSRDEGMPLVVLEAMGHELPVVATRVGAVPLEVQHGVTGLLTEAGDAAELGEALAWLDAHPTERQRMGKQGRQRLRSLFSVEQMTLKVSQTYDRMTEDERVPV